MITFYMRWNTDLMQYFSNFKFNSYTFIQNFIGNWYGLFYVWFAYII